MFFLPRPSILLTAFVMLLGGGNLYSQVGVNQVSPDPSSILDMVSTDKGVLIPRMLATDRDNITVDADRDGLLVYVTDEDRFSYYDATAGKWVYIAGGVIGLSDADGDTKIQVEEGADEDIIRFDVGNAGTPKEDVFKLTATEAIFNENGLSTYDFRVESDVDANLFFVDASANFVGIGTSSPGAALDITGDYGSLKAFEIEHTGSGFETKFAISPGYKNGIETDQAVTFDIETQNTVNRFYFTEGATFNSESRDVDFIVESDGNSNMLFVDGGTDRVGIGTAAPGFTLDVRGSAVFNEDGGDNDFRIETDTKPDIFFVDASTDRIGISETFPDGRFSINCGDNATDALLLERNTTGKDWTIGFAADDDLSFYYDGIVVADITSSTGAFNAISDKRRKKDIVPIAYGMQEIMRLKPSSYTFKSDTTNSIQLGFIAQELYEVIPEMVNIGGDDEKNAPWTVSLDELFPVIVQAMQEQQAIIEELKARIIAIEAR